jgi:hypothetical protein
MKTKSIFSLTHPQVKLLKKRLYEFNSSVQPVIVIPNRQAILDISKQNISPFSVWSLAASDSALSYDCKKTQWICTNTQVLKAISGEPNPSSLLAVYPRPQATTYAKMDATSSHFETLKPLRVLVCAFHFNSSVLLMSTF